MTPEYGTTIQEALFLMGALPTAAILYAWRKVAKRQGTVYGGLMVTIVCSIPLSLLFQRLAGG